MPLRLTILVLLLAAAPIGSAAAAVFLDQPSDAEATAAYRAIPAVAQGNAQSQHETATIKSCKAATGAPGVICSTSVKKTPTASAEVVTIHFARGPDSAWVATLEQRAP
ncbi:hypothetical protein GCM10007874_16170 [Labrys miyagiensis]|uniref:Uncharacterized protein n=1 Tax=Labrys miyagiensis TaxID=346912 RepID=A0ABQ6CFA0_9HYPH|nr:hypothetical protein [Labrys miyagiensis]GLS18600.1 hypothetical protein GCM10007874_16170 [Labrys miyagiensis]